MKDHTRRAVAYIVLRLTSERPFPAIQEQGTRKGFRFDSEIAPAKTKISVFDHAQQCRITGTGGEGFYTLMHQGTGKPISLKIKEGQFDGFDYDSGKPYSGTVTDKTVSLHDAERSQDFHYLGSYY